MPTPPDFGKPPQEDLPFIFSELERQAAIYQSRGYHECLHISPGALKDQVMQLGSTIPEQFRGEFSTPVVAFGSIPIEEQCHRANIHLQFYPDRAVDRYSAKPIYLKWMQLGYKYVGISAQAARKRFEWYEDGAMQYEAVALVLTQPNISTILEHHFILFPGTEIDNKVVPLLTNLPFGRENHFNLLDVALSHIHRFNGSATSFTSFKLER